MLTNFEEGQTVYYLICDGVNPLIREGIVIKVYNYDPDNPIDGGDTLIELIIGREKNKFIYATYDYTKTYFYNNIEDLIKGKLSYLDNTTKEIYKKLITNEESSY